tara:strand:+ start:140 stop:406 length:267 start_codon:yes stop_codon:yes gene_type:complete
LINVEVICSTHRRPRLANLLSTLLDAIGRLWVIAILSNAYFVLGAFRVYPSGPQSIANLSHPLLPINTTEIAGVAYTTLEFFLVASPH